MVRVERLQLGEAVKRQAENYAKTKAVRNKN
jgi:hypothetical protein